MKGISSFEEAFSIATIENIDAIKVRVIYLRHLIEAKKSAGRYKDRNDIENLPSLE